MSTDQFERIAQSFARKDLPESEVELTGEIPADAIAGFREEALKHIAAEIEMPGFRKGNVPADLALKKVGEIAVLEEAVELLMRDFYPVLVETQKVDAVGRPDIRITKLAPGNPVALSIRAAVYPEVTVPKNWKKLAGSVALEAVPDILDAEVEEALESIRRARAKAANPEAPENAPEAEVKPEDLPELTDEFAKSLGNFTDLADLKTKLRENMKQEKEQKAKDARRGKIVEELLEKTTMAVPAIFVESELDKILSQLREDVTRFGMTLEDYLKRVEKSEAQVRDEFRDQARKRAKLQLTLNKLAEDEKVEADKEAVDAEMKHAMEHFPDARPDLVRIHIETVLRNEKVLQLLEGGETAESK